MKKIPVILLMAFFAMPAIYGQIKIGDNPQAISPTSVLELESNDRVLVITRINTAQMDAIVPNQGAMVYNTDTQCIHYYDGAQWVNLCNSAGLVFTTDPIENDVSTIVITDLAGTKNFEVAPNSIGSLQIINGGINGVDIQNGSIGPGKLQDQSVTQEKLSENSVGAFALDNANIDLGDFSNGPGFITGADIVSGDAGNNISVGGDNGAFYDNQPVLDAIGVNTTNIQNHIAADADTNINNEIQTLSFNAGANQLTLTNPSGDNIITLPGGGNPTDELITNAQLTGTDLIITDPGQTWTIPLGGLSGGNPNLTDVLTQGNDAGAVQISNLADPTLPQDAATMAYVDANIGGNQNLAQVLAQGTDGGAALIKNILDPVDPQDAATMAYVDANAGGNQNLAQVLAQGTDGGAALIKNILDPVDPQDAATMAYVLATVASGGALTDGSILIGGAGDVAQQLAVMGDATLANDGTLTIADDAITLDKIAPNGATTNGEIMEWDNDNGQWIIAAPTSHSGTSKSIFFADVNGDPAQAFHPGNGNASLIWDYEARVVSGTAYGALGIGLDGNPINDNVKTHIIDIVGANVSYPLLVQNRTATAGSGVGILFASDTFNDGKGALVLERQGGFGVGDFHFLHNTNNGGREAPDLATDKAFTVRNNSDIVLYGGIDINTVGTGGANEVLTADGAGGITWAAPSGGSSVTDTDTNDGLSNYSAATGYNINVDNSTIELSGDQLRVPQDGISSNEIEDFSVTTLKIEPQSAGPPNDKMLITDTSGTVIWADVPTGTGNLATDNLTQDVEDRTYNMSGQTLTFLNGKVGIGTGTIDADPDVALHVLGNGQVRAASFKAADGSAGLPSYRFTSDLNSGMFLPVADELGLSSNGAEAIRIDDIQNVGIGTTAPAEKLHVGGNIRLDGGLIASNGVGALNEVLTRTAGGTEWAPATGGSTYTAGAGLTLSGANEFAVDASTVVADWTNLSNVPAEFADGTDDDTFYTAGAGLTLSGFNEFSVDNLAGDVTGPTSATVIANGVISNANIAAGAGIEGTKIDPDFGGQAINTTGDITTTGTVDTGIIVVAGIQEHPDYVFEKYFLGKSKWKENYDFKSLEEIEAFVKKYHHLPGIKSAATVREEGKWNLGKSNIQNLEKIEELFLHTIEQENKIKALQSENDTLTDELHAMKNDLEEIKAMLKKSN